MRKKLIFLGVLVIFLSIVWWGAHHIIVQKNNNDAILEQIEYMGHSDNLVNASYIVHGEENEYTAEHVFFNEYIAQEVNGCSLYNYLFHGDSTEEKYDKDIISFTNVETGKVDKEICLNDLLNYSSGNLIYLSMLADYYDGKRVLWLGYDIHLKNDKRKKGYIILDFDSMKTIDSDEQDVLFISDLWNDYFNEHNARWREYCSYYMLMQNESFITANGLRDKIGYVVIDDNANWVIRFKLSDLQENDYLYESFPEMKKIIADGKNEYISFIFSYDTPVEDVVKMFIPDDTELSFEGVFIDGKISVDGNDHMVNSYDEYMSYLDTSKSDWYEWNRWYDNE